MNDAFTTSERKCVFESMFDAAFIELLRLVPTNPIVRALVLKLAGQLPPAEVATFEELRDWVEQHCTQRVRPMPNRPGRRDVAGGISINVEFSETELGRADYSVQRWGTEEFRLGAADVLEIVQEVIDAGGGMDEVVDTIAGRIDDDAWGLCEPDLDNYGDYNYSDHESSDSTDGDTTYSRNDIRAAVRAFLQQEQSELLAEL